MAGAARPQRMASDDFLWNSRPCQPPTLIDSIDFEYVRASWPGVLPQTFLSDFKVKLGKPRRFFYLVDNFPVSEVWMHFTPLQKWTPGAAAWATSQGNDPWIPFPGSGRQPVDTFNQIIDVCAIEFDPHTWIQNFYLSAYNGVGASPNNLLIMASSVEIRFFNSHG